MNASLLNRLGRLESRLLSSEDDRPRIIWVSFVGPGEAKLDRHVVGAECDGRTFVRTSDESASQFQDRIDAESRPALGAPEIRVVLLRSEAIRPVTSSHH